MWRAAARNRSVARAGRVNPNWPHRSPENSGAISEWYGHSGGTLDALRYVVRAGYFANRSAWLRGCREAASWPESVGAVGGGGVMLVGLGKADRDASGLARAAEIVVGPGSGGGRGEPCPGVVHANSPTGWPGCGFAERRHHFAE